MRAEIDYRAALESASGNTEYSALVAGANLCKLALKLWWEEGEFKIRPATVAKEMEKICRTLSKRGIKFRSRPHANARWTYALAAVEAFGGLNRAAESKLERAFQDLLDLGAMTDAAGLALDFCYCLLRELRWEDAITVTSTLLQHPSADQLPRSWLLALRQWESALVKREVQHVISVISPTFGLIRGVSLTWRESCEGSRTPKSRYGDREDTLGL
jgi:hypothetical protein